MIEPLESRIAPAVLINPANAKIATYTDLDGDKVTIKVSTGAFTNSHFTTMAKPLGDQLLLIDLHNGGFDDANLTVSVVKVPGGDGLAHVGAIDSTGHDLGHVVIPGDLGQIDAGDATTADGGLKSLAVRSMGRYGLATQLVTGSLTSNIQGALGALAVAGDIKEASIVVAAAIDADATIASITIGGSLIGGAAPVSGAIVAGGDIGPLKIGRDLLGAAGDESGKIDAGGKLKSLTVGGSIHGGGGGYDTFLDGNAVLHSGQVFAAGDIGTVKIARDVVAGTSRFSAAIHSRGALGGSVTIGGSIIDSTLQTTDTLIGDTRIGAVKIGRDVQGDITSFGAITSLTIGGSAIGFFTSTGAMGLVKIGRDFNATIEAGTTLATVAVTGTMSGKTHSGGQTGLVKIGGNLGINARIESDGGITGVIVGGSIGGGSGIAQTSIVSVGEIGKIAVRGSAALLEVKATAGGLGKLEVGGSLAVSSLNLQGALGSVKAGSLVGGITVAGEVGAVQIAHDFAATVIASSRMKSLAVGGDFRGNIQAAELLSASIKGSLNGSIDATTLGTVNVGGDVRGLIIGGEIRAVTIGGSVIYQDAFGVSANIAALGRLGALKIGGDVQGPGLRPGDVTSGAVRGMIEAGSIGSIFIGGSLRAGTDESNAGSLDIFPLILSYHEIASVTIKGDVRGTVGSGGDITSAAIVALNQVAGLTTDLAIGSVTIGGTVQRANIFAGTGPAAFAGGTNGNASIGAVKVGGDWSASNLVAGVRDTGAVGFGDAGDTIIPGGTIAKIASIVIGGQVAGTPGGDRFGFVSHTIGSFKAAGFTAPLTATAGQFFELSLITADVTIREL